MGRPVSYEVNGFEGMSHSLDGQTPKPEIAWYLQNLIPVSGVLCARPPFETAGRVTSSGGVGQGLAMFVDGGTERLIAVSIGEVYSYVAVSATWTKELSQAQLTGASITLSTTAPAVYLTQLGEYLHISDGVNKPFRWDGTNGGGASSLTNSPVLYGQPTVYYGKLFGIKNADRQTIVWSEENDLTTGYEAGGYSDVWTLTQTGGGSLYAIRGTNEALYYFRASNIGAITGEVGPNFRTTGVHDAVSLERGTLSTRTAVGFNGVWFYDDQSRPAVIKGGVVISLWEQIAAGIGVSTGGTSVGQFYRPTEGAFTDVAIYNGVTLNGVAIYPSLDLVIFWYATSPGMVGVVFHGQKNQALCYFAVDSTAMASSGVIAGLATLESSGALFMLTASTSRVGVMYAAANLGRSITAVSDIFGGAIATNGPVRFVGSRMGVAREMNQYFDTLSVEMEIESTAIGSIGYQYLTSQTQTIATMAATATVTPTVDVKQKHVIGIAGYGRWIAPAITVNYTATNQAAPVRFYGLRVDGFTDAADLSTA